jgi:hypothetical protein
VVESPTRKLVLVSKSGYPSEKTLPIPLPSWSWAYVKGGLKYSSIYGNESFSDIIDWNCEQMDDNTTGHVKSRFVTISGNLINAPPQLRPGEFGHDLTFEKSCSWDSLEDFETFKAGTLLWWMLVRSRKRSRGKRIVEYIVLKAVQIKIDEVRNLDLELLRKHNEIGRGTMHPYATEIVGWLRIREKALSWRPSPDLDVLLESTPKSAVVIV